MIGPHMAEVWWPSGPECVLATFRVGGLDGEKEPCPDELPCEVGLLRLATTCGKWSRHLFTNCGVAGSPRVCTPVRNDIMPRIGVDRAGNVHVTSARGKPDCPPSSSHHETCAQG